MASLPFNQKLFAIFHTRLDLFEKKLLGLYAVLKIIMHGVWGLEMKIKILVLAIWTLFLIVSICYLLYLKGVLGQYYLYTSFSSSTSD